MSTSSDNADTQSNTAGIRHRCRTLSPHTAGRPGDQYRL